MAGHATKGIVATFENTRERDIGKSTHFGGVEDDAADIDHDVEPRWEKVLFSHRCHQKIVKKIRRSNKYYTTSVLPPSSGWLHHQRNDRQRLQHRLQ